MKNEKPIHWKAKAIYNDRYADEDDYSQPDAVYKESGKSMSTLLEFLKECENLTNYQDKKFEDFSIKFKRKLTPEEKKLLEKDFNWIFEWGVK